MGRGVLPLPCMKETLLAWEVKQATVGNTPGLGLSPIPALTYACKGGADPQKGDLRGLAQGGREHADWQGSPSPWSYLYLHGHLPEGDSRPPPTSHSLSTSFPGSRHPDCSWPASVCSNLQCPLQLISA